MVEQRIRNAKVGGSTPLTGTIEIKGLQDFSCNPLIILSAVLEVFQWLVLYLAGCGLLMQQACRNPNGLWNRRGFATGPSISCLSVVCVLADLD